MRQSNYCASLYRVHSSPYAVDFHVSSNIPRLGVIFVWCVPRQEQALPGNCAFRTRRQSHNHRATNTDHLEVTYVVEEAASGPRYIRYRISVCDSRARCKSSELADQGSSPCGSLIARLLLPLTAPKFDSDPTWWIVETEEWVSVCNEIYLYTLSDSAIDWLSTRQGSSVPRSST